jgi:hypothetical protein
MTPLCAAPVSFTLVYQHRGSGATGVAPLSVYAPVSPPGFVALGCCVVPDLATAPDRAAVMCIRASAIRPAPLPSQCLWRAADSGQATGSPLAASFWLVSDSSHRSFVASTSKYPPAKAALDFTGAGHGGVASDTSPLCVPRGSFSVAVWSLRGLLAVVAEAGPLPPYAATTTVPSGGRGGSGSGAAPAAKALRRLLSPPLLSAAISLACAADSSERRVAVLYLLSEILRWAPSSSLTPAVRAQLAVFKRNLEELFEAQTRGAPGAGAAFGVALDGAPPASQAPLALSAELQATLAVFTSLALHQQQKQQQHPARPRRAGPDSDHLPCAPWFHRVVEVCGIVDALVHRDRALPDSFLFAEDTFLRRVALAETVVLETSHPCGPTDRLSASGRGRPLCAEHCFGRALRGVVMCPC